MNQETPRVLECEAMECSYNADGTCQTYGVTIGKEEPCCDTFMKASSKGGMAGMQARVGACHVSSCKFNRKLECSAAGIRVSMASDHPDCATYTSR